MKKMKVLTGVLLCMLLAGLCLNALAFGISGCAYVDDNGNAVCDGTEALMAGVPLQLEKRSGEKWESAGETVTDAYGRYIFDTAEEGEYRLLCRLNDQALYAASLGASVRYENGALVSGIIAQEAQADVGLRTAASLTVKAYWDSSVDGERGPYERDLSGVTVEVLSGEDVLQSGTTNKKGSVSFSIAPGEHVLRVSLADGYAFTPLGKDNCVTGENRTELSQPIALSAGEKAEALVAARPVGSFSGKAFEDMNNNGIMEEGEPGVAGVTVYMSGSHTGTERQITTDESGEYHFERLPDDTYTVRADLPDGMLYARYSKTGGDKRSIFTGSNLKREFSVKKASHVMDKNIGVVQKGAIYGTAFFDMNYNGLWDEGEGGYAGVTVEAIKTSNNESLGKAVTGEDGSFRIENLRGGDYRLRAILPDDGAVFSIVAEGTPQQVNRFAQRASRRENSIQPLTIESGGENSALIGVARGATVRGTVFQDADYNGKLNGKEKIFSNVKVRAVDENGQVMAEDATGKKGQYLLSGLMPGTYTIEVQRKSDYGFTRLRPGEKNGSYIAVLEGSWGRSEPMELAMAQELTGVNAGMLPSATVKGSLFHDLNDNGLWDKGEAGMTLAQVRLVSEDGEIDLVRTPGEDGTYFFDGVMPGKYTLSYLLPEHCEMAQTAKGGNTVKHDGAETSLTAFKVAMGDDVEMALAGALALGSFEGFVFDDSNANGVMDAGEIPLSGAKLAAFGAMGTTVEAESAADGSFSIGGLHPDAYTVSIELPKGYIFSHDLTVDELVLERTGKQTLDCPWTALVNREDKMIGAVKPASVAGEIWMDENRDGLQGENEWILEGLELLLINEADDSLVTTVISNENGFLFENVRPGSYTVRFALPEQSTPAGDAAATFHAVATVMEQTGVKVSESEAVSGLCAGLVSTTSIGGTVWLDENGQRSAVSGVQVTLLQNGRSVQTAVTDENGAYRFDGLWPDDYTVAASIPQGMIFVRPGDPNYADGASIIGDAQEGVSRSIELLMAQHQLESDILCIKPARVGDLAWLDVNRNGLVDGSERRLPGVKVRLVQNAETVYETATDAYGYYLFPDVYPGEYVLEAEAWPQLSPTEPVESLRIISSCLTSGDGRLAASDAFSVLSGENNTNFDLGYILLDGQTLPPETMVAAPLRDWTLPNRPRE